MKLLIRSFFALLIFPLACFAQKIDYSELIPLDPTVKMGKLENGLTYYIKKNAKPENKVDLRLVVNAGSILENVDQQGLAHFIEHMCFNGTKNFPKNQLVDYLQSIGVKFGRHLNAYTSFDETVYFLPIPSDSPEKLEKGFQILEDWAFNTVLTAEEIDKERGVVLEEYRLGLGAEKRMESRYLLKMMYNSKYAERLPIGKKEILENFQHKSLIDFYKHWYRPNLMSVIVVGDIDVLEMENKIISHFSQYKNPSNAKRRKVFEVPNHNETFVAIESDNEASASQVLLLYKDYSAPKAIVNIGDFKNYIEQGLFSTILNNRLDELTNSAAAPFISGYSSYGDTFARNKKGYQSAATSKENQHLATLRSLVVENERVRKFGFTAGELERAKNEFSSSIEQAYNDRDKLNSENFATEYQANFLEGKPAPGVEWTYEKMKQILTLITSTDVNILINDYLKEDNRVVILTGPEKDGVKNITEKEVLEALKIDIKELEPYQDVVIAKSLIRNHIVPGVIVRRESNSKIQTKTLILSNGVKVTYKNTDFKNDEVLFEAISFGGSNMYSNADMKKVQFANAALTEAGFSGLKLNDINKFMAGKLASVQPYIGIFNEELKGIATPKDLEYLFQMTHAFFTDLNFDESAFEGFKQKQSAIFSNLASQPNFYFQQEFYTFLNKQNPRFNGVIPSAETWLEMDYKLAYTKYKERFANAADFEFYFVGNIDDKTIEEFSLKYLASLPASQKRENAVDLGYRMIKGDFKKVVNKGTDPKSNVLIMYYGDTEYSDKDALTIEALAEVLTIKLIEQLRENESGVYGISARGNLTKVPNESFNFTIGFPCGPENTEKLIASALKEVQNIIENGPTEKDLAKFKEGELSDYRSNIKKNRYWLSNFISSYNNQTNPEDILNYENLVKEITVRDIQDIAKKFLSKDKVIGVLMPEEK
ncbi:M16 family metallopeptidase [Flavobacterium weaverense]|uniref:Zinc protease n=1 Tax=Flavobacterium weaverense TaxID=271156 RepID=A0A3M0A345_9FLAO|nr:insulinase family protein [Flavobacterium weaverense]RMA77899.1 zinc protease [Flavobacterium weaverense]